MTCPICLDALPAVAFGPGQPNGLLTLPCQHQLHGGCLRGAVHSAANNGTNTGWTLGNEPIFVVTPPRCPMCRARFVAGGYWADLANADAYPDNGFKYTPTRALGDYDLQQQQPPPQQQQNDADTDTGTDTGTDTDDMALDGNGGHGGDDDGGDDGGDDDGGDDGGDDGDGGGGSDDDVPEGSDVGTNHCPVCGQDTATLWHSVAYILAHIHANPVCFICQNAVTAADQSALVCGNAACQAVSHWHDG